MAISYYSFLPLKRALGCSPVKPALPAVSNGTTSARARVNAPAAFLNSPRHHYQSARCKQPRCCSIPRCARQGTPAQQQAGMAPNPDNKGEGR